jgi:hypothetical protein
MRQCPQAQAVTFCLLLGHSNSPFPEVPSQSRCIRELYAWITSRFNEIA